MGFKAANRDYERWLKAQLAGAVVEADLKAKHKKMRESAFAFLRAGYWRWAETIFEVCPDLADAPTVLAVGDTHLENFGTWHDEDGRIVWGVNDYDECAEMPYILDLVRLATSATLAATPAELSFKAICSKLLAGYRNGLEAPEAIVLDRRHLWLRKRFVVDEDQRARFWKTIDNQYHHLLAKKNPDQPPARWIRLFHGAVLKLAPSLAYWRRTAGTGSLGRPRWLGYGTWRSGPLLRECKALVPSGWTRKHGDGNRASLNDIACGRYRAPVLGIGRAGMCWCGACRRITASSTSPASATPRACCIPICSGPWAATSPPCISACATCATPCARTSRSASHAGSAAAWRRLVNSSRATTRPGRNPRNNTTDDRFDHGSDG